MEEYPFYPDLNESGKEEAQALMNKFKNNAKTVLDSLLDNYLGEVYCNIIPEIESDSWQNYRNTIMDGFKDYNNRSLREHDFKAIRQQIYKENEEEIGHGLNQDNLARITELEDTIKRMENDKYLF